VTFEIFVQVSMAFLSPLQDETVKIPRFFLRCT